MENTDEYKLKPRHVAVTTDVLAFLNSLAMLHGYEKVIYPQFFSVYNMYDIDSRNEKDRVYADSKYPCTLMMAMPNNTRNDTPCEEHIRTMWRVVTRGENEHGTLNTIDIWVDIPVEAVIILVCQNPEEDAGFILIVLDHLDDILPYAGPHLGQAVIRRRVFPEVEVMAYGAAYAEFVIKRAYDLSALLNVF